MTELRDGDLASAVAAKLQQDHLKEIEASGEPFVDAESPMIRSARKSIFTKIDFRWRASDEADLAHIRSGAEAMFAPMYAELKKIIDDFYAQMRIAEINPDTGQRLLDAQRRVIWQRDKDGKIIEDLSQITGQDIEKTLLDIARLKSDVAPRVHNLLAEAVFARHIADDSYQDHYAELVEGTIGDRNAHASLKSREDKYHAFFRWYLWGQADAFLKEVREFTRLLERIRYWRIDDNGRAS
ncbi:hypothetical protein BI081_gp149 [Mycobacterium phage Tonenili]|uniref:Uncharacterized protein n=1 Tax=Mycobacterium phage Tonenili TaxID=1891703 RepID=A0A1C9EHJ6_9CAUD|nr:hypothetical protein BI081_gp149 [Mycobacterium phage Tonenili]AON96958.1 hypothetical protein SEA_TONENILI_238 [Mycobacterium phage Tonenili]